MSLHDGSKIFLNKLSPNWDPTNRYSAVMRLHKAKAEGDILTGLLYIDPKSKGLHDLMKTSKQPLNSLKEVDLCPGSDALENINAKFR